MPIINPTAPILVTGATGYIASWIIKFLLEEGYTVHATVRNPQQREKYAHLTSIAEHSPGTLNVFGADLLDEGSFDQAMLGCEVVMHTASPFILGKVSDPDKMLVQPALAGTRNLLHSANRTASVKRIVLTSSVVAIYGDAIDVKKTSDGVFTEANWNETSSLNHLSYSYSKTMAEREAWKIANAQTQWDLLTINPGFVLGPSLTPHTHSASVDFMVDLGSGKYKTGVPELWWGIVDVRDVAKAHLEAAFRPRASGRHILVGHHTTLFQLASILRQNYADQYPFPKSQVPKWLLYIFGPSQGFSIKEVHKNVGIRIAFNNTYSKQDLGIKYLSLEQTVLEHFKQLEQTGQIKH